MRSKLPHDPALIAGVELQPDPPTFRAEKVVTIAAAHAVHDTYTAFLPPLLPRFIEQLAFSNTQAGLLSVFMQIPALSQPLIGHVADRLSLRYLVILAPFVSAALMSMIGIAPSYGLLAMLLLLAGLSSAAFHAVAPVMAGRLSGQNLGRGMGIWMVGGELGRTLGPIVIVTAISLLGPARVPWLMLAGLLASIWLYARLKDIPARVPQPSIQFSWPAIKERILPVLIPITGIILLRALMVAALTTYLPIFLRQQGANLWLAGAALTLLEGAGVFGALLGGTMSDHWGRRIVLSLSFLTTAGLMLLFLLSTGWTRIPLLLGLGFSALSVTPVIMALVQESFPNNRALANGVYMLLNFTLRSAAVLTMGIMADTIGLSSAYAISAGALMLGLLLVFALPNNRMRASAPPTKGNPA